MCEPPANQVKFLNKQEADDLRPLIAPGRLATRLPLSVLREEVFGLLQRRLTEALRAKAATERLRAILDEPVADDYLARLRRYDHLAGHMDKAMLASLHALAAAGSAQAATLALDLRPDLDPRQVAERFGIIISIAARMDVAPRDPALPTLLEEAKRAYRSFSREGFHRDLAPGDQLVEAFESGVPLLQGVSRTTAAMCRRFAEIGVAEAFDPDRQMFRQHLAILYGSAP